MLLQSYLNKWRLSQLLKLDKLYINIESARILQRPKNDFTKYKNQMFSNNSLIHLRACDDASSYHCTPKIIGSNIPKWDCIFELLFRFSKYE